MCRYADDDDDDDDDHDHDADDIEDSGSWIVSINDSTQVIQKVVWRGRTGNPISGQKVWVPISLQIYWDHHPMWNM